MSKSLPTDPIIFFPGIVFHEFSHVIACYLTGVAVHHVKWFGTDEAYVSHAKPNAWQGLIIAIAPFLLGNLIGISLLQFGHVLAAQLSVVSLLVYWFGFSLVLYSFPSKQDALNAFNAFTDFYKRRVLEKGDMATRFFWLLTFPVFFVPIIVILGLILLFDTAFVLRILWVFAALMLSLSTTTIF
ncbi:MAG: M50 family metallopeptidase [Candidatus Diapherotrites archaeon]|uniref:M50 family metallopeptidase n=1 Tax=Candidatus Iainarchaeum sp. TaxID=3101447 RepID=A0A8T4L6E5_9ARCH|nr:M50 family metallopeptidase [Candidatus Diapherotrites archaeon]